MRVFAPLQDKRRAGAPSTPRGRSIGFKLAMVIAGLSMFLVLGIGGWALNARLSSEQDQLDRKARTYGRFAAKELEPAVAFRDTETAREVFTGLLLDEDVIGVAVYGKDGALLESAGTSVARPSVDAESMKRVRLAREERLIRVERPITPRDGGVGLVVVELSKERTRRDAISFVKTACAVSAAALLVGLLGAWLIGRSISRRLGRLTLVAKAIAAGDLSRRANIRGDQRDEVGQLADAFNVMVERLRELMSQAEERSETERERLEKLVGTRTIELAARTRGMRLVLDHVNEGLSTVDRSGRFVGESSHMLEAWFGAAPESGQTLWGFLARHNEDFAATLEMSWEPIVDDYLPLELCVDQLPKTFKHLGRTLRLRVDPMIATDQASFLIVIQDVTSEIEVEHTTRKQRELASALSALTEDRSGFVQQMREMDMLVRRTLDPTTGQVERRRDLHTLKGNAGMLGFHALALVCHDIESYVMDTGEAPSATHRAQLQEHWRSLSCPFASLLEGRAGVVEVEQIQIAKLVRGIEGGETRTALLSEARALGMESVARPLQRLADYAQAAALRSGKDVDVEVRADDLRMDLRSWAPFWAVLVHVVRNAVSHGIEESEGRSLADKPQIGHIFLSCELTSAAFTVQLEDDGGGIDWVRVKECARQRGVPHSTHTELVEALFKDGFSTRAEVGEMAGRGEGLGAVRSEVLQRGGTIDVTTVKGVFTRFSFTFPRATLNGSVSGGVLVAADRPARRDVPSMRPCFH